MINAALVESFDQPPHFGPIPEPQAKPGQEVVQVLAVGLSRAAKAGAAGKHYTSPTTLPFVAGIDAVVRRADGSLAFVMMPPGGTLAERIVIDTATAIPVPSHADPAIVAATLNAAVSPWIALHARVGFQPGQSILIIDATGNAGSMAVRVAK